MNRLLAGRTDDEALTEQLLAPLFSPAPLWWPLAGLAAAGTGVLFVAMAWTVLAGIGTWGTDMPVAWAFAITNFVWWIGIGHAGTFISAILLLLEQPWRGAINRVAEAMTIFAVMQAGLFPLLHMGRPWFFYWLLPYPATMGVWPQFRSPLTWDVVAVMTYLTVSVLFWYVGMLPDLAAARDRAPTRARARVYGLLSLGWSGSAAQWGRHRVASGILAGVATPLVVSVHTIVSFDFATALVPGWHTTVLPPYFVTGAIHSGFAMVVLLLVPTRRVLGLENVVTARHLDNLGRMLLVTGSLMGWFYADEAWGALRSGGAEAATLTDRASGGWGALYAAMLACNVLAPQVLWIPGLRRRPGVLLAVGAAVLFGMWLERFLLVVQSLTHDFLPSSWGAYTPSLVDGALLVGTCSFFALLFLLFLRLVPPVPIAELRRLSAEGAGA